MAGASIATCAASAAAAAAAAWSNGLDRDELTVAATAATTPVPMATAGWATSHAELAAMTKTQASMAAEAAQIAQRYRETHEPELVISSAAPQPRKVDVVQGAAIGSDAKHSRPLMTPAVSQQRVAMDQAWAQSSLARAAKEVALRRQNSRLSEDVVVGDKKAVGEKKQRGRSASSLLEPPALIAPVDLPRGSILSDFNPAAGATANSHGEPEDAKSSAILDLSPPSHTFVVAGTAGSAESARLATERDAVSRSGVVDQQRTRAVAVQHAAALEQAAKEQHARQRAEAEAQARTAHEARLARQRSISDAEAVERRAEADELALRRADEARRVHAEKEALDLAAARAEEEARQAAKHAAQRASSVFAALSSGGAHATPLPRRPPLLEVGAMIENESRASRAARRRQLSSRWRESRRHESKNPLGDVSEGTTPRG
jgi:IgA-specific serine endopeptidase